MLYRAEAGGDGCTGRIGIAGSKDGINFTRHPEPVLYPEHNYEKGGCEDPRVVKIGDTFYMMYTGYGGKFPKDYRICLATSKKLIDWERQGAVLDEPILERDIKVWEFK
jgi:predicted GH43/DUF377 family glycosyl hydrolase